MSNSAAATKSASSQTVNEELLKRQKAAYGKYIRTEVPADKAPMSFAEFIKDFETREAKKAKENAIELSEEVVSYLQARGWTFREYTPENGPNKGKTGSYAVNDAAKVEGTGFMHLNRERLKNTLERMKRAEEMIRLALGEITVDQALDSAAADQK